MKLLTILFILLFTSNIVASEYEVEFFFTADDRDTDIMNFSDLVTLRQFKGKANWKDDKGGYGVVECMGNHTIFNNKKTLLKMYCKEINQENNNFVIMFDRNSEHFSAGVGKSTYIHAIGKYKKYNKLNCIYAVNSFEGKGSIIKQKCKMK